MKEIKVIFSEDSKIKGIFEKRYELKNLEDNELFSSYELITKDEDEYSKIFVYFNDFKKSYEYMKENYIIFKMALIGDSQIMSSSEIEPGDIILPNTFIKKDDLDTIFIDYAIGNNYDFNKFGLVLNGILYSGKEKGKSDEFIADIKDKATFEYLSEIKKDDNLDKVVVLKYVENNENNDEVILNLINILDLVV